MTRGPAASKPYPAIEGLRAMQGVLPGARIDSPQPERTSPTRDSSPRSTRAATSLVSIRSARSELRRRIGARTSFGETLGMKVETKFEAVEDVQPSHAIS